MDEHFSKLQDVVGPVHGKELGLMLACEVCKRNFVLYRLLYFDIKNQSWNISKEVHCSFCVGGRVQAISTKTGLLSPSFLSPWLHGHSIDLGSWASTNGLGMGSTVREPSYLPSCRLPAPSQPATY